MYLKRLEISGFKSFAKKTVLEFERGITAIVGPNGSGKSNIADCLRWVLGEQSSKLMRGKKSDDVIFAGSDKKVKLGFAEVAATFDNADHKIPIDTAEVSIGRRIDRSGESEYLINGNKVRLLDVVDLVLKSNIGTSRYTVIGQGTIDQMILSGPAEIKGLLDEASGVKTYYIKREKTLRRLEQTAQNLMRAADLMAEIEPRLKSLRRQAKRMEARVGLETELKTAQQEWYSWKYWELKGVAEKHFLAVDALSKNRELLEQQISTLRNQLENQTQQNQQDTTQYRSMQQSLQQLQAQKNVLLENVSLVRGKIQGQKTTAGDPKTLQVELHTIEQRITETKDRLDATTKEAIALQLEQSSLEQSVKQVSVKLDQLYATLAQPADIDWKLVELEMSALEHSFQEFYTQLQKAPDVPSALLGAEGFRTQLNKFKEVTHNLLRNPRDSAHQVQQELQSFVAQKEQLSTKLNTLVVNVSKASLSKEFLQKQQEALEQDRLRLDLEYKKATSNSSDEFWQNLVAEENKLIEQVEALGKQMGELELGLQGFYDSETNFRNQVAGVEKQIRVLQDQLQPLSQQETALSIEKAKADTHLESLLMQLGQDLTPDAAQTATTAKPSQLTPALDDKIQKLKSQLLMLGGVDDLTLQEYKETETRYTTLHTQVTDLQKGMQDLRSIIDELDEHIKVKFNEAFHKINEKFENYFRLLFNGGRAYLSLVKSQEETTPAETEDLEAEPASVTSNLRPEEKLVQKYEKGVSSVVGVDIKATPPGKKLAAIQALSGGERALTSIALLCSLLACFPSPFVVLDEVDAALDDANTIRFGQILGTLANATQFITITHNRETMSQSNTLYGVTMGDDGVSKLLSVKLEQAKTFAK